MENPDEIIKALDSIAATQKIIIAKQKRIIETMEILLIEARRNKPVLAVNNIADALAKEISRRK